MKDAESLLSLLSLHKGPSGFTFHLSPFDRNPGAKTYFSILGKTSVQAQQLILRLRDREDSGVDGTRVNWETQPYLKGGSHCSVQTRCWRQKPRPAVSSSFDGSKAGNLFGFFFNGISQC